MYPKYDSITVIVKDQLPEPINIKNVLRTVEKIVPGHLSYGIEVIYVGQFKDLIDREVNSIYRDGAIYITSDQADEEDMIDDIVHEIAHSVEERYGADIYGNSKLEIEFLKKRLILHNNLDVRGYKIEKEIFLNSEFTQEYDDFLHKEVGYGILANITSGLFISPYAITSLREYFANGFEHFYLNKNLSGSALYKVSPALYRILELLNDSEE